MAHRSEFFDNGCLTILLAIADRTYFDSNVQFLYWMFWTTSWKIYAVLSANKPVIDSIMSVHSIARDELQSKDYMLNAFFRKERTLYIL